MQWLEEEHALTKARREKRKTVSKVEATEEMSEDDESNDELYVIVVKMEILFSLSVSRSK